MAQLPHAGAVEHPGTNDGAGCDVGAGCDDGIDVGAGDGPRQVFTHRIVS